MEENNIEKNAKKKNIFIYLIVFLLVVGAFFGGFFVKGLLKDDSKSNDEEKDIAEKAKNIIDGAEDKINDIKDKIDDVEEKKKEIFNTKSDVPIMDSFVFIQEKLFIINNGDVYSYEVTDEKLTNKYDSTIFSLTHSGCLYDNSSDYCKGNPIYYKTATKIDGLSNVKRLKIYNRAYATDESFDIFAITEDGNVYEINPYKSSDNVKAFLSNNDVEDMIGDGQSGYEFVLKNGKHMIYKWTCYYSEGDCDNMENTYIYEEKK